MWSQEAKAHKHQRMHEFLVSRPFHSTTADRATKPSLGNNSAIIVRDDFKTACYQTADNNKKWEHRHQTASTEAC
jgi:hypothetical protein